jgi:hypothetical protein
MRVPRSKSSSTLAFSNIDLKRTTIKERKNHLFLGTFSGKLWCPFLGT